MAAALRVVDLCAGTGAFSIVFERAGARIVYASDLLHTSEAVYTANVGPHFVRCDITGVAPSAVPPHDILCAGVPCQPFSAAGLQHGFDDARTGVFESVVAIAMHHKPRAVVIENVKGLLTQDSGRAFKRVISSFCENGYDVEWNILDPRHVGGIPHHRPRVFFVFFRNGERRPNLNFPRVAVRPLADFLEAKQPEARFYHAEGFSDIPLGSVGRIWRGRAAWRVGEVPCLLHSDTKIKARPFLRDAHGVRGLTGREYANLQGFPASYALYAVTDNQACMLFGNSVSVPVAELVARATVAALLCTATAPARPPIELLATPVFRGCFAPVACSLCSAAISCGVSSGGAIAGSKMKIHAKRMHPGRVEEALENLRRMRFASGPPRRARIGPRNQPALKAKGVSRYGGVPCVVCDKHIRCRIAPSGAIDKEKMRKHMARMHSDAIQ